MRRTPLLLTGAALVALGVLTGCGSSTSGTPAAAGSITTTGGNGPGEQVHTVADLSNLVGSTVGHNNSVHVTMSGSTAMGQMSGSGDEQFNPLAMQMTMSAAGENIQMIVLNNNFYMQVPGMAAETGGKPWLEISASSNDTMSKTFSSLITSMQQNADPTQMLSKLTAAGTINSQTQETVAGQQTTHYKITVSVAKMAASQTDPTLKQAMTAAQQAGMTDYPVDIWLNSQNLPVQMQLAIPTPNPTTGKVTSTTMNAQFSNWGAAVHITAPAADQIGTFNIPGGN